MARDRKKPPRKRNAAEQPTAPDLIVGLGASTGGLEALRAFFAAAPADSGMAFVIVMHPDSGSQDLPPGLLGKATMMPVAVAADGAAIRADHVYVAPAQSTVHLEGGVLRVARPAEPEKRRAAIDAFLFSLAEERKANAVAVILSGTGSDGALGVKAVSDAGGMVMVQHAASARHEGMPLAAAIFGVADHVLPPGEMPAELLAYARHVRQMAAPDKQQALRGQIANAVPAIADVLRQATGHNFKHYKTTTLVRRIQRRMQVVQAGSVEGYVRRLRDSREEAELLFKELLIGVTAFFRDPDAFAALEQEVIPRLFEDRPREDTVRVWVAGCATGEEAYTVAMLLREHAEGLADPPGVQVFATDIDEHALDIARHGAYPLGIAEDLSPERLKRYFVKRGKQYHVARELRELCLFSAHDLISDPPFSRLDLISCRNLLIYLGQHLQKKLVPVFHYALRPGGYLFLGPSENISAHKELFRPVNTRHRVSQRKPTAAGSPKVPALPESARDAGRAPAATVTGEPDVHQIAQRIILDEFTPRYAVVNEEGRIVCVSAGTGKYLEPAAGPFQNNVVKMARSGLRVGLRAALGEAIKNRRTAVHENLSVRADGGAQRVRVTVQPMPHLGDDNGLYMVVFQDVAAPLAREERRGGAPDERADAIIEQLERELTSTREDLEKAVQDLEAANEELKSSNEELLSMNEELQSANEELETSKEDIQASNEALARTNNDLENLLASTRIATVFLDDALRVQRFTPAVTALYNLIPTDLGRPLSDITHRADAMPPLPSPRELRQAAAAPEVEVRAEGRWFLRRVLPYRTPEGAQSGTVVTFTDITERKRAEEELRRANEQRRLALESAALGTWDWNLTGSRIHWDARAREIFGYGGEIIDFETGIGLVLPDDRPIVEASLAAALDPAGDGRSSSEFRVVHPDGGQRWVAALGQVLFEGKGAERRGVRLVGTLQDVTRRKQAEVELRETLELHRGMEERLSVLVDASGALIRAVDPAELFSGIRDLARRLIAADAYAVWRCDPATGHWRIASGEGLSEEFLRTSADLNGRSPALPDRPIVVEETEVEAATDPLLAERMAVYRAEGVRALLIVPMMIHGAKAGTIVFYYHAPHRFSETEIRAATALANLAGSSITSMELYAEQTRLRAEAEAAKDRETFRAEASELLASSLEYEHTLQTVARLAVPGTADWCAIDILEEDGSVRRLAVEHIDPDKVELVHEIIRRYPSDPDAPHGIHAVIRAGEPVRIGDIPDEMLVRAARDEEHLRLIRGLGLCSYLCVPLRVRDRTFGAMTFATAESGRRFDEASLAFAQDLARRAGQAVENARLYRVLRDSEERFSRFMRHLPGLAWIKDLQGRYVYANDAAVTAFQTPRAELYGKTDEEVFPPETAARFRENDQRALAEGAGVQTVETLEQGDGVPHHSIVNKFPIPGPDGGPALVGGVSIDITERKQAETALRESEERFRATFHLAGIGMVQLDEQGGFIQVNDRFCAIMGRSREELMHRGTTDITHPDDLELTRTKLRRLFSGETPAIAVEKRYLRPDGSTVWCNVTETLVRDAAGQARYIIGTVEDITERRRAAEDLRESEERFRQLAENTKEVFWMSDPRKDQVLYVSPAYEEIWGRSRWSLYERPLSFFEAIHPEDQERVREASLERQGRGEGADVEYRVVRPDGSVRWVRDRSFPIHDAAGRVYRVAGVAEDVTERKRAEQALRQRTETLEIINRINVALAGQLELAQLVQDVTDAGTALTGAEFGAFFYNVVNAKGESYTLYTISGVPREKFARFPMPRNTALFGPTFRGEAAVRLDDATKDPRYGKSDPFFGMPEGHLPVRSYLAVPVVSRSGEVLGGLFFGHSEPGVFTEQGEQVIAGVAGQAAVAIDNARLFQAAQKEIAERRRTEEALKVSRQAAEAASEAKSEFLANMSHEIRTPLTAILGYADVLLKHLDDPDNVECVETIKRNGNYLIEIINDILDLSKIEAGKLEVRAERFAPVEVVADVCSLMHVRAVEKGLAMTAEYDGPVPETIASDRTRLRQVLVNLLSNAVKFTDAGSVRLTVRLLPGEGEASAEPSVPPSPPVSGGEGERGAVGAALSPAPARLQFQVADTGIGMSREQQERLFQPFTQADTSATRQHGGTGLGLAISKRLVEMLGGEITVQSEQGKGSTFTFTVATGPLEGVPLAEPVAGARGTRREGEAGAPARRLTCRVLIADDRRDIRLLTQHFVEDAGGEAELAENGAAAIAAVGRAAAEGRPFDAVVMDMQMPVLDGYRATGRLRAAGFRGAVLALTAGAMKGDREKCLQAGCDDYLSKPIDGRRLVEMIARYTQDVSPDQLADVRRRKTEEVLSASPEMPLAGSGEGARGLRVLVVDDNEDAAKVTALLLRLAGHQVVYALTGRAAVEAARSWRPDVVLLDISLPDISGHEVLRELKSGGGFEQTVFIALSGHGEEEDRRRSREAGFDHHVVKPATVEELQARFPRHP